MVVEVRQEDVDGVAAAADLSPEIRPRGGPVAMRRLVQGRSEVPP